MKTWKGFIVVASLTAGLASAGAPTLEPSVDAFEATLAAARSKAADAPRWSRSGKLLAPAPPLLSQVGTATGVGLAAQAFEAAEAVYSAEAADDFATPAGESWLIRRIRLVGISSAAAPAIQALTVRVWSSTGSGPSTWMPGAVVCEWLNMPPASFVETPVGDVIATVPSACPLAGGTRYWLSAQASQTFNDPLGGQWWWSEQTEPTSDAGAVWRNPLDGFGTGCSAWSRATTCGVQMTGSASLRFELTGGGLKDFLGDGYSDLVYQNKTSHRVVTWSLAGTTRLDGNYITPDVGASNWRLSAIGDLNGDRHPDLIWQNEDSNNVVLWFMNGRTRIGGGFISPSSNPGPGWKVVASGELGTSALDATPDGRDDLLLRNDATGGMVYWTMDGTVRTDGGIFAGLPGDPVSTAPTSWFVRGAGDFDGDNNTDILFQHDATPGPEARLLRVWRLVNRTHVSACTPTPDATPQPGWDEPFAIGDVGTGPAGVPDGKADISFIKSDGVQNIYFMNFCARTALGVPNAVNGFAGWRGAGPR